VNDEEGPEVVEVTFAWDASPSPDVAGYQLLWSTNRSAVTQDLQQTISLPVGQTNNVRCLAIGTNQLESEPSAPLAAFPHYVPWIVVATELYSATNSTGPFQPTGTNGFRFTNGPPDLQRFYTATATIKQGRDLYYE